MTRTLLAVLLWLWVGVVQAQTPEPTVPAADLNLELFADLRFPGELFLEIVIPLPEAEVAQVDVVLQAEGLPPVRASFPPEIYAFADEYVIARYTWVITPETQPPLFSTVMYVWRVTSRSGQVFAADGSLVYADERFDWQETTFSDIPVTVMLPAQLPLDVRSFETRLTRMYRYLQDQVGGNPAFRFLLLPESVPFGCDRDAEDKPIVVANFANLSQENLPCDVALASRAYANSGYQHFELEEPGEAFSVLPPLVVAAFYAPVWADSAVPVWFRSGLEHFYLGGGSRFQGFSRGVIRQDGAALPLEQMQTVPSDPRQQAIWQAQSYGMVLYIAQQIGVEATFALARAEDFAAAYSQATGETLTALIAAWEAWVFTDEAVRVYSYSIYAPTTPTPTATFTPTLTRTPRPPTETPTLTPDYSPTPRPSRTPIPPTRTITPLPAQSFLLRPTAAPTPVPASVANSPIPGLTLPQVVAGSVVLIAGILLVALIARRR